MNIADRVILTIYTGIMAVVSVVVICFALGFLSYESVIAVLAYIPKSWEAVLAGLLLLAVSIRLLIAGISSSNPKELIVHIGDEGTVKISLSAVRKFVEKTAVQIRGVREAKAKLSVVADEIRIKLIAGVLPEVNIPETSKIMQKKLKESVKDTIGREVAEIDILFNTISYETKSTQRFE